MSGGKCKDCETRCGISGARCAICWSQHAGLLRDVLAGVMKVIDDGLLVRNISNDHRSDWGVKALPLIMALKHAQEALDLDGPVDGVSRGPE